MSSTTCPVLYPDVDEMWDLSKFIQKFERIHTDVGICKIIPPRGWYQRSYELSTIQIPKVTPIKQVVAGRSGSYHVTAFERNAMSLKNFFENAKRNSEKHTQWVDKEREFWRTMGKQQSPLYGADMEGTLFDSSLSSSHLDLQEWSFDTGLNDILRMLPYKVPGVNTPMIYVGEWRAMFPFHVEDLDLYSINYLHTGAEKSWYSIAPSRRVRFENLAESHYADDHRVCREYLRHKTKIFSPMKLRDCGMKFDTVVQKAGEFVVTFPGAYHAGFNHDFNIAEATNFATPRWLELGRKATRCICRPHSVFINMDELETLYRRKCQSTKLTLKKPSSATDDTTHNHNSPSLNVTSRKVIDLTSDKSSVETERPTERLLLRCECGEVRPVRLEERAELTFWPVGETKPKLVAQRAFGSDPSTQVGSSFLLRCTQCQFFVHRHCARPAADSDYACYMCRRIDKYVVSADTLVAVSARADEPTGQRASSLKSLQFGSSQSSVDSVPFAIDRNPNLSAKAHRCAKAVQIEDSAGEEEEEPAVTRSRSKSLQVQLDQRDEERGKSRHEKHRALRDCDPKHRDRDDEHKKSKKHKRSRSHSHSGGDGSSSDAAILIDVPAPKRHKSSRRDRTSERRYEHEEVNNAPQITTLENEWEPEPELDLQMRDPVVVVAPGRLHNSVGVITGIEGDLCRFHVKGQKKKYDQWIFLKDCRLHLG